MFDLFFKHAKMLTEVNQRRPLIVKLEPQPLLGLRDLSNGAGRLIVHFVAAYKLDVVGDDVFDDEHIATIRVVFLLDKLALPFNGLANVAETDLGELFDNALNGDAGSLGPGLKDLLNPLPDAFICIHPSGIATIRSIASEDISFVRCLAARYGLSEPFMF